MSLITEMEAARTAQIAERDGILNTATAETFDDAMQARVAQLNEDINTKQERLESWRAQEEREQAVAAAQRQFGDGVVSEPNPVYRKKDLGVSFFRDLATGSKPTADGYTQARERLAQSQERAVGSSGNTFAPPLWLVDEFVKLARAGRTTADLCQQNDLPSGVSSINLPTVATGTTTAVQATQNTSVSNTDMTVSSVSSGITTISGQQQVSMQLLQQSGIPFDEVILGDLVASYAAQIDGQVIAGSGASGQLSGITTIAGTNAVTYTQASPVFAGSGQFYSQILNAIQAVYTNRFLAPDVIVMHPRRWNWVLAALDGQNRPLVVPNGPAFNQPAVTGGPAAEGYSGTLAGIPVYVDPNIPTNGGAGTNQDEVFVMRREDLWLFESPLQSASFDATYANQATILFRVLAYSAFIPNRYPKAISIISGTGLVTPTY